MNNVFSNLTHEAALDIIYSHSREKQSMSIGFAKILSHTERDLLERNLNSNLAKAQEEKFIAEDISDSFYKTVFEVSNAETNRVKNQASYHLPRIDFSQFRA